MKLIFCAIFATLFLQVLAGSHDVEWGEKGPRDYLLFREIYTKKYSFLRVSKCFRYISYKFGSLFSSLF